MTMKIVIDTNVILPSLMSVDGISNRSMIWLFSQEKKINVVSNTLVVEYEDVLLRDRNRKLYPQFSHEDIKLLIFCGDLS